MRRPYSGFFREHILVHLMPKRQRDPADRARGQQAFRPLSAAGVLRRGMLWLIPAILLTSLFFFPLSARALPGKRDILGKGTDYTAILYDSANGLPAAEANAIAQSSDGFLWIGGYSGLIRYDGTTFTHFDASTGISSVSALFVDSQDRVWIGTNENGIALYDRGRIIPYGGEEGLRSLSIRDITEDPDGNILIATTQGLAYADPEMQEIRRIDAPQTNTEYITDLCTDLNGCVYGLTRNGDVFEVKDLTITVIYAPDVFGADRINCLYPDPEVPDILYMGTEESELLTVAIDRGMRVKMRQPVEPQRGINAIFKVRGALWLASDNGVGYVDVYGRYRHLEDLPMSNSVGSVFSDHEGNMWFTSARQGVMKLVPDRFTDISRLAGLQPMVVNSTCVNDHSLYIGTDTGLTILNESTLVPARTQLTRMLDNDRILCIKNDSRGNLWLCTFGSHGLVRYNPGNGSIFEFNEKNGLDSTRIRAVMERRDGSIAVATGNGLYLISGNEITAHFGQEEGILTTEILSIEEGEDGTLYLGSEGDGIYVIERDRISRIGRESGLTSGVIMRIKWDEQRKLFWLITSNSIQYMKNGVITNISGFPYANNYDIYINDSGVAWILSSNGIYMTRADALVDNENIDYKFYNAQSGLPYIATAESTSFLDAFGRLYISGTTGVCLADINADDERAGAVSLVIPSVELDDESVCVEGCTEITIPADCKRLTVNAHAVTFGLNNPRISYHLEGFDPSPIYTTKQELQPVVYTNLNGGRYTFTVSVIGDETGRVEKTRTLVIIKERSIYESILFWAIALIVLITAFAVIIFIYFRSKTQRLMELQKQKQKFIDQIIRAFAICIDMRDSKNRKHSFRVAYYTRLLAEKLKDKRGYTQDQIAEFYNIALLHDIGKLAIPDAILNKPESLTTEEYEIMKGHAASGAEILKNVNIVKDLAVGAGCHHERMDGRGYPQGLKGSEIPEVARIIAVADTFDAMYSTRPYRRQLELSVALHRIREISGTQLESDVVDALMELAEEGALDRAKVEEAVGEIPLPESDLQEIPDALVEPEPGDADPTS